MRFELRVALRYLSRGGSQTVLTIFGVAAGVTVYIFIATLIAGLQRGLVERTIGSISHVTLEPPEATPRVLPVSGGENLAEIQPFNERRSVIRGWAALIPELERQSGVTAVSPLCSGPGLVTRGGQVRPVTLNGIEQERGNQIIDLRRDMTQGRLDLAGQNVVVGKELARLLGVQARDKVRIQTAQGRSQVFTIAGVFDAGNINVNERSVFLSLGNAQRMLDMVGDVTAIETKVADVFGADAVADRLAAATGLQAKSWMRDNTELLGALQSQDQTTRMIRFFVLVVVATGVASVLIVSVLQRSREIGILKSMGASTGKVMRVFLFLGFFIGFLGSFMGITLGGSAVIGLSMIPGNNPFAPGRLFPIAFETQFLIEAFLAATLVGTLAGIAPARRAAKMDPVDVIRYG